MALIDELGEDNFGHWLAGFIDGEGSFVIRPDRSARNHGTRMQLAQRADGAPLLRAIHSRTGLGSLYVSGPYGRHTPKARPQVLWVIFSKRDCAGLVRLLDRYPLLSKKARDYEVWRRAVLVRATKHYRGVNGHLQDWSDMQALKVELEAVREYVEQDPLGGSCSHYETARSAAHATPRPVSASAP